MTCICTCWAVEGKEGRRKGWREGGEQWRGGGGRKGGGEKEGERERGREGEREGEKEGGGWVLSALKGKIKLFILPLLCPPSLCAGAGPSPGQ